MIVDEWQISWADILSIYEEYFTPLDQLYASRSLPLGDRWVLHLSSFCLLLNITTVKL